MRAPKRWVLITGWVLSLLPAALFLMSAAMKLMQSPQMMEGLSTKTGFQPGMIVPLGIIELVCVIVFLVPRTAVIGAVLITGYVGGIIATHLRMSEGVAMPVILGLVVWAGIYLREPRLHALLPLRKKAPAA